MISLMIFQIFVEFQPMLIDPSRALTSLQTQFQVFPRSAVYFLRGKEKWINEARVIREDEEPYKWVKARPNLVKNT